MPPISGAYSTIVFKAVLALLTIGVSVGTGIAVVGSSHDSFYESTGTPLLPLINHPVAVRFSPTLGLEPCPTCLFFQSDDVLPDDHDSQPSLHHPPTPTVPLEISYADPFISHPKPTPTPPTTRIAEIPPASTSIAAESSSLFKPITPPPRTSTFVFSITWRQNLFFCIIGLVYILSITNSHLKEQLDWSIRWGFAAIHGLLEDYFNDEERLIRVADMRIIDTVGREKAKIYESAIHEIEKLRKVHADQLNERYERDVFAAAKIKPSFGPSIENAEAEFWERLEKIDMTEGTRGEIIGFFRNILHSFSHAIAVGEVRPEGSNTRYLSVIHEQDRLIDSLRLLHLYREQAFAEHEDLIMCLCRFNPFGELEVPEGHKNCPPWNMYSVEDHSFIVSPRDGPTALSMNVSVSSAPFDRRPVTILDSDPHWQIFLDSAARKQSEQEARFASHQPSLDKDVKEEGHSIQDGGALGTCDVSQCNDKEHRNETEVGVDTEIKEASEQSRDGIGRSDDHTSSHEGGAEDESDNEETIALRQAENHLIWLKGVLASMKASQGTPESPNPPKSLQNITSAMQIEMADEIAATRQLQEQLWAEYPREAAIEDCEIRIDMLEVDIACMRTTNGTSDNDASNGEAQAEPSLQ